MRTIIKVLLSLIIFLISSLKIANAEEIGHNLKYYNENFQADDNLGIGIRAGSFLIRPQMGVEEDFSDNIYASENNKISDFMTVAKPVVEAKSDWERNQLNLKFASNLAYYQDHTTENYKDYNLGADGKIDIRHDLHLIGDLEYFKTHEERYSPDNTTGVVPNRYSEIIAQTGIVKDQTRVTASLIPEVRVLNYNDNIDSLGDLIDNSLRSYKEYGVTGKIGYEIAPGYTTFISSTYNIIDYDKEGLINKNSNGYRITTGTDLNITGKLRGEAYVGYLQQNYDSNNFSSVTGADFGGNLVWQATGLTSVKFEALRSVNETILDNAASYLQTYGAVTVEHELLRNVLLMAKSDFANNEYKGIDRNDNVFSTLAGAKYYVNRNAFLKLSYKFQNQDSNVSGAGYDENRVIAELCVGL